MAQPTDIERPASNAFVCALTELQPALRPYCAALGHREKAKDGRSHRVTTRLSTTRNLPAVLLVIVSNAPGVTPSAVLGACTPGGG
jgi:hypothetical protein